jgi:surface polysaccharide O-acyltransferase-like enzyme
LLLIAPSVAFAAYRILVLPSFPSTHALFGDWYDHCLYATVFLFGFLLARAETFWDAVERQRWLALSVAAALFISFLLLRWNREAGAIPASPWFRLYAGTVYGGYQWLCIVAVLGFARRWLTADSPARRYFTDAIFPYYIIHQTAIIMIAHELQGRDLPAWLEATIVIVGTFASCAITYEVVRRVTVLRPLFGLRIRSRQGADARATAQPAE